MNTGNHIADYDERDYPHIFGDEVEMVKCDCCGDEIEESEANKDGSYYWCDVCLDEAKDLTVCVRCFNVVMRHGCIRFDDGMVCRDCRNK